MIRFISWLIFLPLIVLIAAFTFNNAQPVTINLFVFQIELPIAVIMLISLLIGVVMGFVINLMTLLNQKKKYLNLKRKKETLKGLSEVLKKPEK